MPNIAPPGDFRYLRGEDEKHYPVMNADFAFGEHTRIRPSLIINTPQVRSANPGTQGSEHYRQGFHPGALISTA